MMRLGRITMACPWCMKTLEVDREATDPPAAVRVELFCDDCHTGREDVPLFYDRAGEPVHATDHLP